MGAYFLPNVSVGKELIATKYLQETVLSILTSDHVNTFDFETDRNTLNFDSSYMLVYLERKNRQII